MHNRLCILHLVGINLGSAADDMHSNTSYHYTNIKTQTCIRHSIPLSSSSSLGGEFVHIALFLSSILYSHTFLQKQTCCVYLFKLSTKNWQKTPNSNTIMYEQFDYVKKRASDSSQVSTVILKDSEVYIVILWLGFKHAWTTNSVPWAMWLFQSSEVKLLCASFVFFM